jgi:hypothetical protein
MISDIILTRSSVTFKVSALYIKKIIMEMIGMITKRQTVNEEKDD